jgi:hypothetical protein
MPNDPQSVPLPQDLDDLRHLLLGAEQGATLDLAELGNLAPPLADFADWLALVTPTATPAQLGPRLQDRLDRTAQPLTRYGTLQEADWAQLGQLSPPHTPLGTRSQGLDRLWDLFNGQTPAQQANAPQSRPRGRER